ncbi:hypothetical protein [Microbispora sp. NBRC 16548]|uniref:hypothetical protein n=1 Tax=Microbispora sp. NBRC 16548 TaxID=3030994 RepID=UPI0024A0D2FB|nr:hypothetical protein [Microbispora sp. NBRC 16548]GLX05041.1 hypothetical protein Misp03_19680 [Microbispora sp. NBRC 16548]
MTATPDPGETFVHENLYLYGQEWEPGRFFAGRPVVEPGETVADPSAVAWALTNGLSGNGGEPGLEQELRRLLDSASPAQDEIAAAVAAAPVLARLTSATWR